jgi:hypothetical protein
MIARAACDGQFAKSMLIDRAYRGALGYYMERIA